MKLFIGVVPPEEYREKVLSFQKQWPENKLPARIEPHITLKAPFDPPQSTLWLEEIRRVCERTRSLIVSLGEPSFFGERVVFLSVKSKGLYELHQEVIRVFTEATGYGISQSEGKTYTPHLTLGNTRHGLSTGQIKEMGELVPRTLAPYPEFQVYNIRVYQKQDRYTPWTKMVDLPLQKLAGKP